VWGGRGEDGGDTSGGNTTTGGSYPPAYITINAKKSQRLARSAILFYWRSRQRGMVEAPGVELGSEDRQHTGIEIII
jgi:hypothetical protein